ncbi:MAG: HAD-IA family hydrolase [Psychromonas sp.]|nr:HAD-IA family hydrolase [Psychromonas sp.]
MRFYRSLKPFKAISFDLDDTLYDNQIVMDKAEARFIIYLNKTYAKLVELTAHQWGLYKIILKNERPELTHDVSLWRIEILKRVMIIYGICEYKAIEYAQDAFKMFLRLRSDFVVPADSIKLLRHLAKHYPVVAITNGNVDAKRINIADKFSFILMAGQGYKAKPAPDLFIEAAKRLHIDVNEILHIGDDLVTDVYGSQHCGAQSIWFNKHKKPLDKATLLPSIEIQHLNHIYPLSSKMNFLGASLDVKTKHNTE